VESVVGATCELVGSSIESLRVLDCSSGLDLPLAHSAAGLCLWITQCKDSGDPDSLFGHVEISPTVPWIADSPVDGAPTAPSPVEAPSSFAVPSVLDPVANLDAERLLLVTEPSVTDLSLMLALRNQTMSSVARTEILANQGTIWADDEIWFHLTQLLSVAKKPTWAVMDPLLCAEAIKRPSSGLIGQWIRNLGFQPTAILGVVCCNKHWTPFIWTWTKHCTIASSWDVPGSPPWLFGPAPSNRHCCWFQNLHGSHRPPSVCG